MGEWKVTVTMRLRQPLKEGLLEFAAREHRSLGNLGEILMEWAFEQLNVAGSTERLRTLNLRKGTRSDKKHAKGKAEDGDDGGRVPD